MTAKTCAIPSLHRDSFLAKVPGPCPDAASGNTTSPYCRAVMFKRASHLLTGFHKYQVIIHCDKYRLNITPRIEFDINRDNLCPYIGTKSSGLFYRDT